MRTSLRNRLITLSLLSACSVGSAYADQLSAPSLARKAQADLELSERNSDSWVYIGVGFGQATNRYSEFSKPRHDSAYKVFAGYAYNKYFATELSYLNITDDDGQQVASTVQLSGRSYVGSAVGRLPMGDYFSVMGKIGYAAFDTDANSQRGSSDTSTKGDFSYGVVAAVDLGKHFAIRTEYEAVGFSHVVYDIITLSGVLKF